MRVLESTIAQETMLTKDVPAAELDSDEIPDFKYDYRIAISTASQANSVVVAE